MRGSSPRRSMTSTAGHPRARPARDGVTRRPGARISRVGQGDTSAHGRAVAPGPLGHHRPRRPRRGPLLVVRLVVGVEHDGGRQARQRGEGGGPRPDHHASTGPGPRPTPRAAAPPARPPRRSRPRQLAPPRRGSGRGRGPRRRGPARRRRRSAASDDGARGRSAGRQRARRSSPRRARSASVPAARGPVAGPTGVAAGGERRGAAARPRSEAVRKNAGTGPAQRHAAHRARARAPPAAVPTRAPASDRRAAPRRGPARRRSSPPTRPPAGPEGDADLGPHPHRGRRGRRARCSRRSCARGHVGEHPDDALVGRADVGLRRHGGSLTRRWVGELPRPDPVTGRGRASGRRPGASPPR